MGASAGFDLRAPVSTVGFAFKVPLFSNPFLSEEVLSLDISLVANVEEVGSLLFAYPLAFRVGSVLSVRGDRESPRRGEAGAVRRRARL